MVLQSEFPYSICAKCINSEWFKIPIPEVWDIMCHQLYFMHHGFETRIHGFVLMSNHFHLLVSTPQANISQAMAYFMRESSRAITRTAGRINQTYGGRYFRCIVSSHHYFLNAYKYFYRNPVEAGLSQKVEDYPFSTLHGLIGKSKLHIPIAEDLTYFSDPQGTLNWLNTPVPKEDWESVRKALRNREFHLAKDPFTRKPSHLETSTI